MNKVTTSEAKALIASNKAVMIDLYADWCGPCKMLSPIIAELASAYEGRIEIVKLNVDEEQQFAMDNGVMSIPTLMGYKNGELIFKSAGYMPKKDVEAKLQQLL